MEGGAGIVVVRGSEVRCTGPAEAPHADRMIFIPVDETARCPDCGRAFRRASLWNVLSGATWPRPDRG